MGPEEGEEVVVMVVELVLGELERRRKEQGNM